MGIMQSLRYKVLSIGICISLLAFVVSYFLIEKEVHEYRITYSVSEADYGNYLNLQDYYAERSLFSVSISPNFASKAEISDLLTRSLIDGRLSGTFINPNNNGFVFALFGVYFLVSGERAKYILLSISGVLIVLSQSRTAFLAFLVVLVLVGLWLLSKHSRRRALYFLGGMCLFLMVAIQLNLKNLNSIFDGSAFRSNSITTRFEVIQKTIEVNEQNIWLGHGKINNIPDFLGYSIDNEYAYLYLEYGAIGIFFFLLLIGFLGILSMVQNKGHPVSIGLLLIMLVCGLTNLSFTNMEVGPVFALLFACALRLPGAENTNAIQNQSKA